MRIARVLSTDGPQLAVAVGDKFKVLPENLSFLDVCGDARILHKIAEYPALEHDSVVLPPVTPGKIIGIGLNFRDTITEMGFDCPAEPYLFGKLPSSVVGPGADIEVDPEVSKEVDWEVELAAVIGTRARDLAPAEALGAVIGYTATNDVSARDLQRTDGQWVRGKSLDTFCPLGPVLVTADEVDDPQRLRLRTWVNDELVQDGNTADMIFPVAELVSYCSRYFTLEPGDVILTGTPAGCGGFANPPRYLSDGDSVRVEVEGIGELTNRVRFARFDR